MNIFITGFGCISPIGYDVQENRKNLILEKNGLVHSSYLESKYAKTKYFGEIPKSTESLSTLLNFDNILGLTRTDIIAFIAFNEACEHAKLSSNDISSTSTVFISASTVGGMNQTNELYNDANFFNKSSVYINSYNCGAHTLHISQHYKIKGITNTINTACSSSANAILLGTRLIKSGRVKRVIVGGVDSLAKYTVNGFNSLQILSNSPCSPFDENRDGLNLGEAAAYIVLESEESCKSKTKYARIIGTGNANDAFHVSALSDNGIGIQQCMQKAIDEAQISKKDITYINAHGTGTPNNDLVESNTFQTFFEETPLFSSTKSYTGHTLGASGALESIYCILSLINNELYPNLQTKQALSKTLLTKYISDKAISSIMSNSYGFGGNCTSLIFSHA